MGSKVVVLVTWPFDWVTAIIPVLVPEQTQERVLLTKVTHLNLSAIHPKQSTIKLADAETSSM